MIDKGYLKNMNKLQSRLQVDNSRPAFLEDGEWHGGQKFAKLKRSTDTQKNSSKNSKVFDLDQIKKQLGLIELRNNTKNQQLSVKNHAEEEEFIPHPSSFKKQKSQQNNFASRCITKKKENDTIEFDNHGANEKSGFTQRITELVKMREQHQKIISSLVHKKSFNLSTDEGSMGGSRKRNNQLENKYMKVLQSYEINRQQKIEERKISQIPGFKKQILDQEFLTQTPTKKRTVEEMYQNIQAKLGKTPKKKQSPKPTKTFQTQSEPIIDNESQHISESRVEECIQATKQNFSYDNITPPQQIAYMTESMRETSEQLMEESRLNESTFQMHEHVNLIASLSQFELNNQQIARENAIPLHFQLHYSILSFLESTLKAKMKQNQFSFNSMPEIQLKYACVQPQYQGGQSFLKAVKKIKGLNRDFQKIVEFLCQNEIWEGLLTSSSLENQNDNSEQENFEKSVMKYHGLCFDTGSYTEVILSNRPLEKEQKKLLVFRFTNNNQTLLCDISLVLLSRLINLQTNKTFPEMLHRLFGYQFKTFKIDRLNDFMEYLDFIDRLRQIHNKELKNEGGLFVEDKINQGLREKYSLKQTHVQQNHDDSSCQLTEYLQDTEKKCDFFLYGLNKTTKSFQLIKPCFFSQKNKTNCPIRLYEFRELMRHEKYMKRLSQTFSVLSIINKKELPVKSINLRHFENHFVVVSVNLVQEGLYFMSVGGKYQQSNDDVKYRLCLISSSTKTILECMILSKNESCPVYLPEEEYQVYISAYHPSEHPITSSDIMNFTFYIQSPHICAKHDFLNVQKMEKKEIEFQLRLKEEYKNYTSMVVEQFIELSFLDREITQFFVDIQNQNSSPESKQKKRFHQRNQEQIPEYKDNQQKVKTKLDLQFTSTVKSLNCQNFKPQIQSQKGPSRYLDISEIKTQNKLSHQCLENPTHTIDNIPQEIYSILTFEQMQIEEIPHQVKILRVHLKALDLFIDCINTSNLIEISTSNCNEFEFKIKYSQQRVLCDLNHHKNTVLLRSNTINLVYLTKDSQIESVTKQNEFCQNMHTKSLNEHQIVYKLFRKEW